MPFSGCLWVASPSPVFPGFLIPLSLASALFTHLIALLFRWSVRINFPSSLAALPDLGVLVPLSELWVRTSGSPPGHSGSDKPAQSSRLHLQGGEQRDPMIIPFQKHIAWRSYRFFTNPQEHCIQSENFHSNSNLRADTDAWDPEKLLSNDTLKGKNKQTNIPFRRLGESSVPMCNNPLYQTIQ